MGAARHMWWKILGLAAVWPAWTVTRTFLWHPRSASDIGDVLACLTAILITLTAARHRGSVPSLATWWRKREIGRLKAQLAQHEAEASVWRAEIDGQIADLFDVMDEARQKLGIRHPDLETTLPMLRPIRGGRAAG